MAVLTKSQELVTVAERFSQLEVPERKKRLGIYFAQRIHDFCGILVLGVVRDTDGSVGTKKLQEKGENIL